MINRIYVEKKSELYNGAEKLRNEINNLLNLNCTALRKLIRYDIENIDKEDLDIAKVSIFSEPPLDIIYNSIDDLIKDNKVIIVDYLKGQYDQRADSAMQCVQLLTMKKRPVIKCSNVYILSGVNDEDLRKVKKYLINPVESMEGNMELPITLINNNSYEYKPEIIDNFINFDSVKIKSFYDSFGFAMNLEDIVFVQDYFKGLKRNPSLTELKVIDTYWSDHCRHTTFLTEIKDVKFITNVEDIEKTFKMYKSLFKELYEKKPYKYTCLMDIATIAAKALRKQGYLDNLDVSDEINACSVVVNVDVDGINQEWLIMFKNETHNHPTEIEPFGGAATCLGGAIRDPLSGRTYVYQAMRVTGASDPRESYRDTLSGKIPQRILSKTAANGFSSYGNQIGLATGMVTEIYHSGYKAKRLETGYVIGGAPKANIIREKPQKGDVIILLGGDTGRDGCGGATGSSKSHTVNSVELCGAEVQKGNAPEERKLQRLFRNSEASELIIKCNDFGAGGVCVAIGELADGLDIYLDRVEKKYEGLTATELAISESQERMAVVIKPQNVEKFIELAHCENLKATIVAYVTDTERLKMFYKDNVVVDLERKFLDTNGVKQTVNAIIDDSYKDYFNKIDEKTLSYLQNNDYESAISYELGKLNICSQKGLSEMFDSTIGAGTVLMPFGGKNQITPSTVMASKPPVNGYTKTVTCSSFAYYPDLMTECQFIGAVYSIVSSVSKLISCGCNYSSIRLTLQEFFKKLHKIPENWGMPMSALLGALNAQLNLNIAAIGGKDSMSGTFENIDVPPTLISFAMGITNSETIIHNAFSYFGYVYWIHIPRLNNGIPDYTALKDIYKTVNESIKNKAIINSAVVEDGGVICALSKSLFGNDAGIDLNFLNNELFKSYYGDLIVVCKDDTFENRNSVYLGSLNDSDKITHKGKIIENSKLLTSFTKTLEDVYPTVKQVKESAEDCNFNNKTSFKSKINLAKPSVFIPVFPGTNCEYDTAKAFNLNGAETIQYVINNQSAASIENSINEMVKLISNSQIIAFPGGFSGGDEPDGSGKFISTTFKNQKLKDAILEMLYKRDGLILGVCNGFQAVIKLGLVPYGKIINQDDNSPTLSFNNISRHISTIARIKISSNKSPWLSSFKTGEVFNVPISHGEGKFICNEKEFKTLKDNGQIATQYIDLNNNVTMISPYNPNGSYNSVEGILSPDGKVFGKMGHSERYNKDLYKNIDGNFNMNIFKNGVNYYK